MQNILPHRARLRDLARDWLMEDCPSFDFGACIFGAAETATASLYCKQPCVLSGVPFFDAVFDEVDCKVVWNNDVEGTTLTGSPTDRQHIATVSGLTANILRGERVALNVLARCSGISTAVAKARAKVGQFRATGFPEPTVSNAWHGRIACTRKTTPGFRLCEKYAVIVGGGDPHRLDLSTMTMLKDNHIDALLSGDGREEAVRGAVQRIRDVGGFRWVSL